MQRVDFAALAFRASVSLVQRRMRYRDAVRSTIRLGAIASMAGGRRRETEICALLHLPSAVKKDADLVLNRGLSYFARSSRIELHATLWPAARLLPILRAHGIVEEFSRSV